VKHVGDDEEPCHFLALLSDPEQIAAAGPTANAVVDTSFFLVNDTPGE
jgi:hypothetical protein